jgi:two-component system, NarL family, response regulator
VYPAVQKPDSPAVSLTSELKLEGAYREQRIQKAATMSCLTEGGRESKSFTRCRLVVAADLSITRKGIVTMLAHDPLLQVIAETEDGLQAMTACRDLRPDVLILALRLARFTDIAVTRLLIAGEYAPRILVLSEDGDETLTYAALDTGAAGVLPATVSDVELCSGVHRIVEGETLIPEFAYQFTEPPVVLGLKERLILNRVAQGLPNKAIARQQGISVRTVGNHLQHIFRKLEASNRMEAVMRARQKGLLQHE